MSEIPVVDRDHFFWQRVGIRGEDECWPYLWGRSSTGYGSLRWNGRVDKSHRVAYELAYGEVPDGLWVLHHCDNPPCCNPYHLYAGTPKDNVRDMMDRGRDGHGDCTRDGMNGSVLTTSQVQFILDNPQIGGSELSRRFGCSRQLVSLIRKRVMWLRLKSSVA